MTKIYCANCNQGNTTVKLTEGELIKKGNVFLSRLYPIDDIYTCLVCGNQIETALPMQNPYLSLYWIGEQLKLCWCEKKLISRQELFDRIRFP